MTTSLTNHSEVSPYLLIFFTLYRRYIVCTQHSNILHNQCLNYWLKITQLNITEGGGGCSISQIFGGRITVYNISSADINCFISKDTEKKYCRCKISCKLIYFYMRRHFFFPYSKSSLLSFMLQFVRIFFILMQSISLFKIDILFILYTYISYKHLHFYQSVLISCCNLMSQLL